jgi:hypothetical protein
MEVSAKYKLLENGKWGIITDLEVKRGQKITVTVTNRSSSRYGQTNLETIDDIKYFFKDDKYGEILTVCSIKEK